MTTTTERSYSVTRELSDKILRMLHEGKNEEEIAQLLNITRRAVDIRRGFLKKEGRYKPQQVVIQPPSLQMLDEWMLYKLERAKEASRLETENETLRQELADLVSRVKALEYNLNEAMKLKEAQEEKERRFRQAIQQGEPPKLQGGIPGVATIDSGLGELASHNIQYDDSGIYAQLDNIILKTPGDMTMDMRDLPDSELCRN